MIRSFILSALALVAAQAMAADTDPLDFDYQVIARAADRPAMVFNDGLSTYIQPRHGQVVQADGAIQNGPYWVIDGVPEVVRYSVSGQPVVARWKRANGFTSEPANPVGDMPRSLAAISGRLAMIGNYAGQPLVRAGRSNLPLAQMIKSIAPAGWTGTAQKDISLTDDVALDTRGGENWLQALARVLEQRNLYAEVDFTRRNIALRAGPPKSFSVAEAGSSAATPGGVLQAALTTSGSEAAAPKEPAAPTLPVAGTPLPEGPTLASAFGALAIRDNKQGRIEIRFEQEPKDLVLRDETDSKIWTRWDEAQRVLSFATLDRFTATADGKAVEVRRLPEIDYEFPRENSAGLEMVFEKDGATYLSFARSLVSVSVFGDEHQRNGEHKDRYYKFNGIAARLTVIADGNVVYVDRSPQVRFKEQPGKVAL
ncbi:TrbG/VirB9 family P-type conjugative transfer protein [Cupriavidus consociatus]|uniref:TrbG/VirB9 family P-type conjugative transfer protein n=1 Tax=Cupriavidus consociatus TaxID=2821357 RepID=UPI001AE20D59|nr:MULTISPECIES: TrbG/VirB9 family P-type conjugative transfer protein [unclassified Cupriavidus]MBP0623425.1 TrbG/VirB9 family P-type conjugative transfer protein [Cupriavidus sp. LEh25]MDK2660124.1 TrbG/VirB9 family P-type conjugative transfer protein [Cupriavidus sp. LEh21]